MTLERRESKVLKILSGGYKYKFFSWQFCAILIIGILTGYQVLRWAVVPQFVDIYYHLQSAWAFNRAGGYVGWDFWNFAPVGRINIYPPFFPIFLAVLLKLKVPIVFLAKLFEIFTPLVFFVIVFKFFKEHFSERFAFFVLLSVLASFSFFISLGNHIPATLAMIMGVYAWDNFLKGRRLRAVILFALIFFTHIGLAWVFIFSLLIFGMLSREDRAAAIKISIIGIILSLPLLLHQFRALPYFSAERISEKYFYEFKLFEYLFLPFGLIAAVLSKDRKIKLLLSYFLANILLISYPSRYLSAEGYLSFAFLIALAIEWFYKKFAANKLLKNLFISVVMFSLLFFSPTLVKEGISANLRIFLWDSALSNLSLPQRNSRTITRSIWFPDEYLKTASFIKKHSEENDIIYSNYGILGVSLGALSQRPTANALLPEVDPSEAFDPLLRARIVVATRDMPAEKLAYLIKKYELKSVEESKLFTIFISRQQKEGIRVPSATVRFEYIFVLGVLILAVFLADRGRRDHISTFD